MAQAHLVFHHPHQLRQLNYTRTRRCRVKNLFGSFYKLLGMWDIRTNLYSITTCSNGRDSPSKSASALEGESGYSLESPTASRFREAVMQGSWPVVELSLAGMGLTSENDLQVTCSLGNWTLVTQTLQAARFLVSQQKYLELLEGGQISGALEVLRNELAPTHSGVDKLHLLSRFVPFLDGVNF